jgi:hypothetical protein
VRNKMLLFNSIRNTEVGKCTYRPKMKPIISMKFILIDVDIQGLYVLV